MTREKKRLVFLLVASLAAFLVASPVVAQPHNPPVQQQPSTNVGQRDNTRQLQNEPNRLRALPATDPIIRDPAPDPVTPPIPTEMLSLELFSVSPITVTPPPGDKETADKVLEKLK
jgi:hypothetical protein